MSFLLRSFSFLFLFSCFLSTFASLTQHLCQSDQRDALLEFKSELLVHSDGICNPKSESWVNKNDCCSWDGITCGVKSGKVIGLDLSDTCLHGQLESNSSLFRLPHLRHLNLASNNLSGEFPSNVLLIPNLESVVLDYNPNLRGNLPVFRENNSFLELSIQNTAFSGTIPDSISSLKHLTSLILSNSQFSGKIPFSIGNLSHLSHLDLTTNKFVGKIPSSIGNLSRLFHLDLSSNNFVGEIPSSIGNLKRLTHFDVSHNELSGNLPTSILNLNQLIYLYLSSNQFTGSLPFDLNVFSPLKQLQTVSLSGIPISTANITSDFPSQFEVLHFRGCNITEFPEFIRYQRHLKNIDLSNNKIKGQVPYWLWRLPELSYVYLSENSLSGFNGSLEASPGSQIILVDLRSNAFQGPLFIPSKSLQYFYGSKNNFTGEIPRSICGLSFLNDLDLSDNNLHGSIPRCLETQMSSLSNLNLRNNSLSGSLPEIFTNAKGLMSLDVSHNQMEGKLPASLTGCSHLKFLNVGNNRFYDSFPFQLKSLQELQVLVLRSNKFHGTLYNADGIWSGFPQLIIIDISHNDFHGTLPSNYFVNWTAMFSKGDDNMEPEYISNPSSGLTSTGYYTSLVLMSKGVSMEMERILTIYTAIDFSGNQLHGQIPDSIGLLKEIHILNMSSNVFTGHIPSSLANLTNLESLDLSQNKISGQIPPELGILSSLQWINVSHNQLVGSIPQGTQFQRQRCSSYEGNPGLHGPSLKNVCGDLKAPTPPLETKDEEEEEEEEEEESLSWIAACVGFAPGVVFGLTVGYIVASYKHKWFMRTFGRSK